MPNETVANHPPSPAGPDHVPIIVREARESLRPIHNRVVRKPSEPTKGTPRASVILPAFNEEHALPGIVMSLHELFDHDLEIIIVDDGSTDRTHAIAMESSFRVLRHDRNQGKGAAVRTGVRHAQSTKIVVLDADNTYPVDMIPIVVAMMDRFDFVHCVRQFDAGTMPVINRIGNTLFNTVVRTAFRLQSSDILSGMYGIDRECFDELDVQADGFDLEIEIKIKSRKAKLVQAQMTIPYQERLGEKKLRPWQDGWLILRKAIEWEFSGRGSRSANPYASRLKVSSQSVEGGNG